MSAPPVVVAIDGPAAAGKGTLARRLAAELGLPHLDTGLLYRGVARRVLDRGADPRDAAAAEREARALLASDLRRGDLRGPEADMAASAVSAVPGVRAALLAFQREFGRDGAVLDGRDIGTVVFPDALAKLFVTASVEARARRRYEELRAKGVPTDPETVEAELRRRDKQDAERNTAPLRAAPDALVLDTTTLDIEAAFAAALALVRERLAARAETPPG
jgi:cytidylate kinase